MIRRILRFLVNEIPSTHVFGSHMRLVDPYFKEVESTTLFLYIQLKFITYALWDAGAFFRISQFTRIA
jgi:hypothetical protein